MSTQSASNTGGSVLARSMGRMAPFMSNPLMAAIAAPVVIGGTYAANRDRQVGQPNRIGSQIGASSSFDAMTELSPRQRRIMEGFDENQMQQYQDAIADSTTNQVRLGQMAPEEARARVARASFTMPEEITNSGQLQQGAMSASDLPDATSQLGDYNGLGLDNEYLAQLKNAQIIQGDLTQDAGDQMVSREFDRTAKYRIPIENYRMNRDFAYGQKAEQNTNKRAMASGLLNSYANTAQALMTSGL